MRAVWFLLAAGVAACTAGAGDASDLDEERNVPVPDPPPAEPVGDAGTADASGDASDADVPIDDGDYPATCTADILCPNGPFLPDHAGGFDTRTRISAIRGRSPNDVWFSGSMGALGRYDGTSWKREDVGTEESLRALWIRSSSEVALSLFMKGYARGISTVTGTPTKGGWVEVIPSYTAPNPPGTTTAHIVASWAAPGDEYFWVVGKGPSAGGVHRLRVGTSALEGTALLTNCSSTTWCKSMNSVHGHSADTLWLAGESGETVRVTNATAATPTVTVVDSQAATALHGVWSASANEAWAVGALGTIRHYSGGTRWAVVPNVPTNVDLNAVYGSSPTDVWAVGDNATVLHYDGTSWTRVKIAGLGTARPNLTAAWSPGPGQIWIGGEGVMLTLGGKK